MQDRPDLIQSELAGLAFDAQVSIPNNPPPMLDTLNVKIKIQAAEHKHPYTAEYFQGR